MSRKKQAYRVGGPAKDPKRSNSPYWCKWYELVTDKAGSREIQRSRWFATLKDAEAHGQRVTGSRADVRDFTDQERLQCLHFFRECEARRLSPFDVFAGGLRNFNASEGMQEITAAEALELYCTWMTGEKFSIRTIKAREQSIAWMMRQTDPQRMVSDFLSSDLVALAKGRYDNHVSRCTFLRDMKSFFSWAARNHYCTAAVAADARLDPASTKSSVRNSAQRRTHKRPPRLKADEIAPMFKAVDPRYHPALALAVFAGLRPDSELPLIEWAKIDHGHLYGIDFESRTIHLHESWVTKTFMERMLHDLPDPLWAILERHRQTEGRVSCVNYTNWRKFVIAPIKKKLKISAFPTDYLRHTALSFMSATIGQEATMNNAGHTNHKTFYAHYNNAVGKAEAEQFQTLEL